MTTGDEKLVAHSKYLLHAWEEERTANTYLCKIKAHSIKDTMSKLKQQVDKLAKEARQLGPETLWKKSDSIQVPICLQRPRKEKDWADIMELQQEERSLRHTRQARVSRLEYIPKQGGNSPGSKDRNR